MQTEIEFEEMKERKKNDRKRDKLVFWSGG